MLGNGGYRRVREFNVEIREVGALPGDGCNGSVCEISAPPGAKLRGVRSALRDGCYCCSTQSLRELWAVLRDGYNGRVREFWAETNVEQREISATAATSVSWLRNVTLIRSTPGASRAMTSKWVVGDDPLETPAPPLRQPLLQRTANGRYLLPL